MLAGDNDALALGPVSSTCAYFVKTGILFYSEQQVFFIVV